MKLKKISFAAASIISLFILLINANCSAEEDNIKYYSDEMGTLAIMYHRFNEPKYPSTNIQMDIFKKQMDIINDNNYTFYNPNEFAKNFDKPKKDKKILITIDDGFISFYKFAWPYLKKEKIPFILFVSTEAVGKFGYMDWDQIKEIEKEKFAYIGHHSHSHDYLVDFTNEEFIDDIIKSTKIFREKLNYSPIYFSYPFGEYNDFIKEYISKKFNFAFGQHSGVIDINKDKFELPRFPINEKYGDLERFKFLINLHPLQYKEILPKNRYLKKNNPPNFSVSFFKEQENIEKINCFSDEGNKWEKSNLFFEKNILKINFRDKFLFRRGRVNCSLNDNGIWRWFGIQFSVKTN